MMTPEEYQQQARRIQDDDRYTPAIKAWALKELREIYSAGKEITREDIINVDFLRMEDIDNPHSHYGKLRDTFKFWIPTLNEDQLLAAVSITAGVCPHCYENNKDCVCWNDE